MNQAKDVKRNSFGKPGRALLLAAGLALAASPSRAATATVEISGFAFVPASVTINVGDKVTWLQRDATPHNSVSDASPPLWSSPLLSSGQSFSFTFNSAGTFRYHCSPHPFMTGTVTVRAANQPPTVSLASPAGGTEFTAPAAVHLVASPADSDGQVAKVDFFAGTTLLGTASGSPFEFHWAGVSAGTYVLTAVATDNLGAATTSAPVAIVVKNAPLEMAGLEDLGAGLELSWRGGAGPYLLQKKANVNDLAWQNVLTTPANYITVAKDTQTAFYRVMDQPQGIVIPLTVTLSGANEVPAVATAATGLGTLTLEGAQLTYRVAYSGLSGPATAAHIHGPAPATAGAGVLFGLSGAAGTAGVLAGTQTVTPDQFVALVTGQTYVNIHTTTFGGGEVRGQVMPLRIPVALSGGAEIPAVATSGAGSGVLTMIGNKMFYDIDFGGLPTPATAAHLHGPADATAGASPLFGMSGAAGTAGTLKGLQTLTPEQVAMLLAGNTYVNVHTSAHPGGELRGQAIPLQFSAFATGAAELPAVDTPATASGVMTLVGNQFSYNVTYSGLSANATAAHIHGPADVTQSAGVLFGLTGASGTAGVLAGVATLTPDQVVTLMTGKAYVNIHTTAHGGGEVRGQVRLRQ